ncbi:hypothetical protein LJB90_00890 [Eubacteriales bacterium OttesenSCG-928-G02]|nr:hypothetical protein [Eubacteriales bacterium OttesenSCG-928-G02]
MKKTALFTVFTIIILLFMFSCKASGTAEIHEYPNFNTDKDFEKFIYDELTYPNYSREDFISQEVYIPVTDIFPDFVSTHIKMRGKNSYSYEMSTPDYEKVTVTYNTSYIRKELKNLVKYPERIITVDEKKTAIYLDEIVYLSGPYLFNIVHSNDFSEDQIILLLNKLDKIVENKLSLYPVTKIPADKNLIIIIAAVIIIFIFIVFIFLHYNKKSKRENFEDIKARENSF